MLADDAATDTGRMKANIKRVEVALDKLKAIYAEREAVERREQERLNEQLAASQRASEEADRMRATFYGDAQAHIERWAERAKEAYAKRAVNFARKVTEGEAIEMIRWESESLLEADYLRRLAGWVYETAETDETAADVVDALALQASRLMATVLHGAGSGPSRGAHRFYEETQASTWASFLRNEISWLVGASLEDVLHYGHLLQKARLYRGQR
jgi:hypothetical protein